MSITFGPSKSHPSYNTFLAQNTPLGDPVFGGYLICRNGSTLWIVAPSSTEVSRNWYSRDDAVTTAESNAACGDWFVPNCGILQNLYYCRTHWDSYSSSSSTGYWSSTASSSSFAFYTNFSNGSTIQINMLCLCRVRAFRCVTY